MARDNPPELAGRQGRESLPWAAQDFRSAKALLAPSLKRDIVPLYCMHTTSGGRVAWQSKPIG